MRLEQSTTDIASLPAWLTTVTTRLCLDRLRARVPEPTDDLDARDREASEADPADEVALADSVGVALQVVLDHLTPAERVAFVLHDTFGVEFPTVAAVLGTTPPAARKLASRARAKVVRQAPAESPADWEVVDAFLAASRAGNFAQLLHLLAPDVVISADPDAVAAGTPQRLAGRDAVAAMFDGAAQSALPVLIEGRPGAAWFYRGEPRVAFDFTVARGRVAGIRFRAEPEVLTGLERRTGAAARSSSEPERLPRSSSEPER